MKQNKKTYIDMKVKKIAPHTYCINQGDYNSYGTKGGMLAFNTAFDKALKQLRNDNRGK